MRISDWSSDVCFSDLVADRIDAGAVVVAFLGQHVERPERPAVDREARGAVALDALAADVLENCLGPADVVAECIRLLAVHLDVLVTVAGELVAAIDDLPHHAGIAFRSEEHTSELQSLMRISYAVFCLKKKTTNKQQRTP